MNSAKFFQPLVLELHETNLGEKENIPGAPCLCRAAAANVSNYYGEFACIGLFHPAPEGLNFLTTVDRVCQPTSTFV